MLPARLARDRSGTAAIEFGLILPIMVLLVMGLADTVRRNLAMIDVDAAASLGADLALRHGFDPGRIAVAMTAQAPDVQPGAMTAFACNGQANKREMTKKAGKANKAEKAGRGAGRQKRKARGRSAGGDCTGLPGGRYVRISASTMVPSPFGPVRSPLISAAATVRLP